MKALLGPRVLEFYRPRLITSKTIGMLFAPVSGEEARGVIREKASDVKDKWDDVAAWAGLGSSQMPRRSTGTYAD